MNKNWWWLVSYLIVGVLLGAGILHLVTRPPTGKPIELVPPPTPTSITVYMSGEVNAPGLIQLPAGSRVNDAIQAAGGFTADANGSGINLAKILEDGMRIDIPALALPPDGGGGTTRALPATNLVNINTASVEELDTLPGIGPITAQDIIDYRSTNGPFSSLVAILDVDGIGQVTFDKIKNLITVGSVLP